MDSIVKYPNRWPAGVSGNPNGRPPGHHTRHVFSEAFLQDLAVSWGKDGAKVLERVARENPASYFSVCARLLPSDVSVLIQTKSPALSEKDISILQAIEASIPGADEMEPQAVLEYVLAAIRAYDAKVITSEDITEGPNG
jgi:hypothetical protein